MLPEDSKAYKLASRIEMYRPICNPYLISFNSPLSFFNFNCEHFPPFKYNFVHVKIS
jgi:hypothetical protein